MLLAHNQFQSFLHYKRLKIHFLWKEKMNSKIQKLKSKKLWVFSNHLCLVDFFSFFVLKLGCVKTKSHFLKKPKEQKQQKNKNKKTLKFFFGLWFPFFPVFVSHFFQRWRTMNFIVESRRRRRRRRQTRRKQQRQR